MIKEPPSISRLPFPSSISPTLLSRRLQTSEVQNKSPFLSSSKPFQYFSRTLNSNPKLEPDLQTKHYPLIWLSPVPLIVIHTRYFPSHVSSSLWDPPQPSNTTCNETSSTLQDVWRIVWLRLDRPTANVMQTNLSHSSSKIGRASCRERVWYWV